MVSIMTALWFRHLRPEDRVWSKPHASPVLHALNHLLGELDASRLSICAPSAVCRAIRAAQRPRSGRLPTGSVGTAPRRRSGSARPPVRTRRRPAGRQYALVGDAELDEGAVWEAVPTRRSPNWAKPSVWIVDPNRQSFDRVVPNIAAGRLHVRSPRLAGRRSPQVRHSAENCSRAPVTGNCGSHRRHVQLPSTSARCAARRRPARPTAWHRAWCPGDRRTARGHGRLDLGWPPSRFSRRSRLAATLTAPCPKGQRRPAHGDLRVHGQGARPCPPRGHPQNHSSPLTLEQMGDHGRPDRRGPRPPAGRSRCGPCVAARLCAGDRGTGCADGTVPETHAAIPADIGRTPTVVRRRGTAALGRVLLEFRPWPGAPRSRAGW